MTCCELVDCERRGSALLVLENARQRLAQRLDRRQRASQLVQFGLGVAEELLGGGLIVLHLFYSRARGIDASRVPACTVAGLYLLFGAAALVVSGLDPFFLVFIGPGALVLVGVLT